MTLPKKGLLAAALLCSASAPALAAWPADRPIEVIVAYNAGGSTDVAARAFLPILEKYLPGASFAVINKPGAGGEIGTTAIANAKPDGYTIGFLNAPSFLQKPYERKTQYTKESFTYIANLVYDPGAWAVLVNSPFKSLQDVIDQARKSPGQVTVATAGVGTDDHINITRFQKLTGTKLTMVPFSGDNPAITAVLGGHAMVAGLNTGAIGTWVTEGKLRPLAVAAEDRTNLLPDTPTFKEQGVPLIGGSARGIGGPKGMPQDVVQKLSAAIAKAVADPAFIEQSKQQFVPVRYLDSGAYRKFIDEMDEQVKEQWEEDPWIKK